MRIQRDSHSINLTIANGAALSDVLDFEKFDSALLHMPAAWTAASIGFQVASSSGGTFLPFYDAADAIVEIPTPTASQAYEIPETLRAARFVKIWSQTAESDVNQGAERAITVDVKA